MLLLCLSLFLSASTQFSLNIFARRLQETSLDGGWLARLGWGLGEAEVSVVDHEPVVTFAARVAFFGTAIAREGLVGYLIPLSSFTEPCSFETTSIPAQSRTLPPPPFLPLDVAYTYNPYHDESHTLHTYTDAPIEGDTNVGCPTLCPTAPNRHPSATATWIALVRRGECDFVKKSREAQRLGAKAIVVGSLDESLLSMSSRDDARDIHIPAIYITRSSYLNLTNLISSSGTTTHDIKTVSVMLLGEPPWEWYTPILSLLVVLSLPSLLTLCTLLIHRARAARAAQRQRAPEDIVNSLPSRVWNGSYWEKASTTADTPSAPPVVSHSPKDTTPLLVDGARGVHYGAVSSAHDGPAEGEASSSVPRSHRSVPSRVSLGTGVHQPASVDIPGTALSSSESLQVPPIQTHARTPSQIEEELSRPAWFSSQVECAICISGFEIGDRVRVLPCGHIFHQHEIDPWLLKQRKVCPVCKHDVTEPPSVPVSPATSPPSEAQSRTRNILRNWFHSRSSLPAIPDWGIIERADASRGDNPSGEDTTVRVVDEGRGNRRDSNDTSSTVRLINEGRNE